ELGVGTKFEADRFLTALVKYDQCWRSAHHEALDFTFIGHSEGGYEALAMAELARQRSVSGQQSVHVSGVVTIDGAIHPAMVYSQLQLGSCFLGADNPFTQVANGAATYVKDRYLRPVTALLNADAYFHEYDTVGQQIDLLQQSGVEVATVTNDADQC